MSETKQVLWHHPLIQVEEVTDQKGQKFLVVHRGKFAAVCLHLISSCGEEAFLIVKQERPTAPEPFYEHPAGMVDADETPLQAAIREVAEETGWLLLPEDLQLLTPHSLYPSPAFWNEAGYFYAAKIPVPLAVLKAYARGIDRNTQTNEHLILLTLSPQELVQNTYNLQTLAHTLLYYGFCNTSHRILSSPSLTNT
ncbi:MAG: NUDIX hydrolase [Bacteroidia bacterium]|nr:NUDIX hydrolase [Bacteroidia bacterium]MDW8134246.1 NUDIX hydrolase [Bacteroidia bacterium]